jgi:hypothetical protein
MNARFKIDFNPGSASYSAFVLLYRTRGWFFSRWKEVYTFETIEAARLHYEKIKDMPEYLP